MNKTRNQFSNILFIVAGAIILLAAAVYNGFPILYSDTSTYISSGFTLETPIDRPIMYGLFLRLSSFNGFSIWSTVFFQGLIISSLIFITVRDFTRSKTNYPFIIVISALSFLTALPYVSGQIIADIFTPICFLCLIHILFNDKLSRISLIWLFLLFFLSTTMHMSHLSINFIVVLLSILLSKIWRNKFKLNIKRGFISIGLILVSILFMGSALSKSKHVFFTGRMAENGILQEYLAEHCPEKNYKLCDCIDSIPNNTTDFLWHESSPLYTRYESWSDSKNDFNEIIWGSFTSPHYIVRHFKESVKNTLNQLVTFNIGDGNGSFEKESLLFKRVKKNFPNDHKTYLSSKQYKGQLTPNNLGTFNVIYQIFVFICLIITLVFLLLPKSYSPLKKITILLLVSVLVNCFINSSLVIIADRFGAKTIWLIPLLALLFSMDYLTMNRSKRV